MTDIGAESDDWIVGPRPTEDMLAAAYLAMKEDGTLRSVIHQAEPDLRWWLDSFCGKDSLVIGAYRRIGDSAALRGMGFVNQIIAYPGLTKAEVGFAFWGENQPSIFAKSEIMKAMLDLVFERTSIDSLLGLTPDRNPGAVALIRRIGMRVFGPIPNYCVWHGEPCGAYVSQMDKQTWLNRRSEKPL